MRKTLTKIIVGFLIMLYGYEFGKYVQLGEKYNVFFLKDQASLYISMLVISICLTFIFFKKSS